MAFQATANCITIPRRRKNRILSIFLDFHQARAGVGGQGRIDGEAVTTFDLELIPLPIRHQRLSV